MPKKPPKALQIASPNRLARLKAGEHDSLAWWMTEYFRHEVTTQESSQKEQRRDLKTFLSYLRREVKHDHVDAWTPRLTSAFKTALQSAIEGDGSRHWSDRSINRMLAHLKTFAKWVHKYRPFALGNPAEKIKAIPTGSLLVVERALTTTERRKLLDAADLLPKVGGLSKDRNRYSNVDEKPRRKGYRPYRNRALIYTLIETGMRRAAACKINLVNVHFDTRDIEVEEKGSATQAYKISREGLQAITDYLKQEREFDAKLFDSPALFLPAATVINSEGRLAPRMINDIWNEVSAAAGVEGKTPHSARHAMGKYLVEKTGNIAAVQRQLGHKNAAYSLQYARVTSEELGEVLDERE